MSKSCFKYKAPELLEKLDSQPVPIHKAGNYRYVKRSLELIEEGYKGTVVFGADGAIAGAAAYSDFQGGIFVETLGSIGKFDGKVTPGMSVMYDIFKVASKTRTGKVALYATPEGIRFYQSIGFVESPDNGRLLYMTKEMYSKWMKWYTVTTGKK
jgi:hypothetical protein